MLAGRGKVGIASCRTEAQKRVFYGRLWFSSSNRCTHGVVEDLNMYTRICLVVYLGTRAFLSGLPTGSLTKGSSATPPKVHNPPPLAPKCPFPLCHSSHAVQLPLFVPLHPGLPLPGLLGHIASQLPASAPIPDTRRAAHDRSPEFHSHPRYHDNRPHLKQEPQLGWVLGLSHSALAVDRTQIRLPPSRLPASRLRTAGVEPDWDNPSLSLLPLSLL